MSRHSGVRNRALSLAVAAACAGGALTFALSGNAASASPASVDAQLTTYGVSSSAGSGSVVRINEGDSVIFSAGSPPPRVANIGYAARLAAGFAGGSVELTQTSRYRVTFANAGSFPFSWTPSNAFGTVRLRNGEYTSATLVVAGPPGSSSPPPSSPAGSSPGSSPPAGSTGGAPPGSSVNLTAAPGSSVPGFAAPPSDHSSGTTTAAGSHASGASAGGSGSTVSSGPTTPGPVSKTTLFADVAGKPTRPVGLAILCILALATVTGIYAYQRLGGSALRSARRR